MPLSRADRRRSKVSLQLKPSELKAVEKQMKRVEDMRAEVCSWLRAFKPRCDMRGSRPATSLAHRC